MSCPLQSAREYVEAADEWFAAKWKLALEPLLDSSLHAVLEPLFYIGFARVFWARDWPGLAVATVALMVVKTLIHSDRYVYLMHVPVLAARLRNATAVLLFYRCVVAITFWWSHAYTFVVQVIYSALQVSVFGMTWMVLWAEVADLRATTLGDPRSRHTPRRLTVGLLLGLCTYGLYYN
jgi:hypothetical protein